MGVEVVESRIAQIQSTIQTLSSGRTPVTLTALPVDGSTTPSGTGTTPGPSFEDVLGQELAATPTPPTTPAPTTPRTGPATVSAPDPVPATGATGTTPSAPAADPAKPTGASGDAIVATAKKYLGVPYVWGGNTPSQGFDCSGLVKYVMKELGVDMPRVARDQAKVGTEIASLSEARPGDLLGMRNGKHIAIYLGDNKILHAPQPGEKVSIRSLFPHDDIDTIRRVAPNTASSSNATVAAARAVFEAAAA